MIRNYFKIAFRNLWRNKGFSAINILGLAIGITTCLIILLFVYNELSYDRFNAKSDRIVRVTFQGSADLRWINDRKLGGISAGDFGRVLSVGGFLNIKPPNLDLYLQVVRVPEGKFADKLVSDMREYVCTAEEVAGHAVSYEDFRDALTGAVRDAGIDLDPTVMTDVERGALT